MSSAVVGGFVFLGICLILSSFLVMSVRLYQEKPAFIAKILKYLLIAGIWVIFSVASIAIGLRINDRHEQTYTRGMQSVNDIWGGAISQTPPLLTYNSVQMEEFENPNTHKYEKRPKTVSSDISFSSQNLDVKIDRKERQKGLLKYPGYILSFKGEYIIKNTRNKSTNLYFLFQLPQNAGNITDIQVLLNDKPYKGDTNLADGISWSENMEPDEENKITVSYKAQGTETFSYLLGSTHKEIKQLKAVLNTDFRHYNIPDHAMVPSSEENESGKTKILWNSENLITGQNISLKFEIEGNYGKIASKLFFYSPLAIFLFLALLLLLTVSKGTVLHPMHYLFIIISFFIFYLLGSYLISYMHIFFGILASLAVSTGIMIYYAFLMKKGKILIQGIALSAFVFQWFFSIAFFFPEHTGFLITAATIIAFVFLLKTTAETDWEDKF
ncbi:MAG TPA: hypothetical protein PKK05_06610 [Leptospiraceae bacterium]|nr:hypothetical protein [Leptospiraceae bacterium]